MHVSHVDSNTSCCDIYYEISSQVKNGFKGSNELGQKPPVDEFISVALNPKRDCGLSEHSATV